MKKIIFIFFLGIFCLGFLVNRTEASLLKTAASFRKSHQFKKAIDEIERYLQKSPNDRNGLFLKGLVLADLERYTESIKIFEQLIKAYPATPELYNNLGTVLAYSGKYENSQKAFQKALHLMNNYRSAHKNIDALKFATDYVKFLKKSTYSPDLYSKTSIIKSILDARSNIDTKTYKQVNSDICNKLVESQMLIRQIQTGLARLGYYKGKIDGTFHKTIKNAIQEFQSSRHIKDNGFVSWELLARIQNAIDEKKINDVQKKQLTLTQINTRRLTQKIQHGLYDLGYDPGPQNGMENENTLKALSKFKNDYNIQEKANISFEMSGHIMKALYQIQGKWTMVPLIPSDLCTHYVPLIEYINNGYKPILYIGYGTILKHKTGNFIMIVNTPTACQDMKKLLRPSLDTLNEGLKKAVQKK
ncbi:secreted protein containing Peptidoglycan binding-like domain protein [Candidatus Magnetomorum sp. HK-1]|nr:secreted protein containing Peptidoglycan binding-like domain protein [Candidatus Magnetomorum sp. HK-1]